MSKIRIYELANELELKSSKLISILNDLGLEVSSHMNTLDEETVELVKEVLADEEKAKSGENGETADQHENEKREVNSEGSSQKRPNNRETKVKSKNSRLLKLDNALTVKDLADRIHRQPAQVIKTLIGMGIMANINQKLEPEVARDVAEKYGYEVEITEKEKRKIQFENTDSDSSSLKKRPPVVTVMGHVDHGKTSLLDAIRKTNVMGSEAGGITQHIGAYQVTINGQKVTFIDTPGHEAFTSMRARGAQATDIAILVIAADDGVMPQTEEAINHAQIADVPIIVAINKIDKPNAQPDRVKQELTEYNLIPEEWGGETICVEISALKGENIDELLEMLILSAEMEELKADPEADALGVIVEAELDKGRGPVATVLIRTGTLRVGDSILAGTAHGRVRAMIDDKGRRVEKAGPSTPVEVLGLSDVPAAGELLEARPDAREEAGDRERESREEHLYNQNISLDRFSSQIKEGELQELNVVVKGDVQGSIEALRDSLERLSTEEVKVNVIHGGVGRITKTDVMLAAASQAIIIGFNVRPDPSAAAAAEKEKVEMRTYRIIYRVLEDVRAAMEGMLEPDYKEVQQGRAEIRAIFKVPDVGNVAGCYVLEGRITRNSNLRLIRDGVVVTEGDVSSLKRFEDDVREVQEGYECGIKIENYDDIREGDIIEAYTMKEIQRKLS